MTAFKVAVILTFFRLFSGMPLLAQSDHSKFGMDTSINMYCAGGAGDEFNITISKKKGLIKITYLVTDSINTNALKADRQYKYLNKRFENGTLFGKGSKNSGSVRYLEMLDRHKVKLADSISFPEQNNLPFSELVNEIASKSVLELVSKGYRFGLDGFTVHFKIFESGKLKEFGVYCPSERYEPLIVDLIKQTVAIYRGFNNQNLLIRTPIRDY